MSEGDDEENSGGEGCARLARGLALGPQKPEVRSWIFLAFQLRVCAWHDPFSQV